MNLNEFMHEVHENALRHGWWESERSSSESVVLIHSEWSEAIEEARAGRPMVYRNCMEGVPVDECAPCNPESVAECLNYEKRMECEYRGAKPEGIAVELADGVIRILDLYGKHGGALSRADSKVMIRATKHANPLLNKQTPLVDIVAALHSLTARAGDMMLQGISPRIAALAPLEACVGLVLWWIEAQGEDPEKILREKHEYNKTRPYKHGKKF